MRLTTPMSSIAFALLASISAAVALAGPNPVAQPHNIVGLPNLQVSEHYTPPYVLASPCAWGEVAITFRLTVRNYGTGASPAINDYHALWVQDSANPAWAGGMTLPAIPVNNGIAVDVPLVGLKNTNAMQGHHVFNATFKMYGGNSLSIPVDFPPAFCTPPVSVAPLGATAPPQHTPLPYSLERPVTYQGGPAIPAPRNLDYTNDSGVCSKHFPVPLAGPLACAASVKSLLTLVWDWSPRNCNGCPTDVDGYKVYRVDAGQHALIATQAQGTNVTVYGVDKPIDGTWQGKCYVVTAYKGSTESPESTQKCVSTTVGTVTLVLNAQHINTSTTLVHDHPGFACVGGKDTHSFDDHNDMIVGYAYDGHDNGNCAYHDSQWWRAAVVFDLSKLKGKKLWKATLNLPSISDGWLAKGVTGMPETWISEAAGYSCITEIGTGTSAWWQGDPWLGLNTFDTRAEGSGFSGNFDVTVQVRQWLQGTPNYGFVFRSSHEGEQTLQSQLGCKSLVGSLYQVQYALPTLSVEYFE
jgi:hypothetical protein